LALARERRFGPPLSKSPRSFCSTGTSGAGVCTIPDDGPPQCRSYRLASIRADQLSSPAARARFWSHARWSLDRMRHRISPADRAAIEAVLAARVERSIVV
jgi:hypothetical protein